MAQIPHKARRYGYRLKKRFREDPFSTIVLYAIFISIFFLIFAFRGLIATIFIEPIGVVNPGSDTVVESTNTNTSSSSAETFSLRSTGVYTVKSGDTLYAIAVEVGSTVEDLAKLNDLEPSYSLSVGQEIELP